MNKLPVFKTVGQVFGFVVERRFFTLLRLIWFPSLLSVLVSLGPAVRQYQFLGPEPQPEMIWSLFGDPTYQALYAFSMIASFVLSAVIAVCVHRMIFFGDTRPGTFFYLRFTGDEGRYLLAFVLYSLVILAVILVPIGGHFAWVFTQERTFTGMTPDPELIRSIAMDPRTWIAYGLGLFLALIVLTRLGLVFPIVVAEGRLSFARSWELTRGNFWRLIGFWIVTSVLAIILIMVVAAFFAFAMVAMMGMVVLGGETVGALGIIVFAVPLVVSALIYVVVGVTLFIAALSFSYKALAGDIPQKDVFA